MCLVQGSFNARADGGEAEAMLPSDNRKGVYFKGYKEAVPQTIRFGGDAMLVDDERLRLDHR